LVTAENHNKIIYIYCKVVYRYVISDFKKSKYSRIIFNQCNNVYCKQVFVVYWNIYGFSLTYLCFLCFNSNLFLRSVIVILLMQKRSHNKSYLCFIVNYLWGNFHNRLDLVKIFKRKERLKLRYREQEHILKEKDESL